MMDYDKSSTYIYNTISKDNKSLCIKKSTMHRLKKLTLAFLSILKSMLRANQIKSINHGYIFAIISIDESTIYN